MASVEPGSTQRRIALAAIALVSLATGVIASLPSCGGPPDKTCFADRVNAFGVTEDAGPDRECTNCLQTKNAPHACCDAVGACDEDPDKQCAASFKATHLCVVDGGASEESRCKGLLTNDRSKTLYSCMRSNCGRECGIPSCDLDPAVILFANPACDGCMGNSCCETINTCYKDRRCKLIVECITKHCPNTLGPSMTALGLSSAETRAATRDAVCHGRRIPGGDGPGACLQRCLDDFAPEGEKSTIDDQDARCRAFDVYKCGAEASCGPKCMRPDAGPYAGDGEWEEDNPSTSVPDASAPDDAGAITDASSD